MLDTHIWVWWVYGDEHLTILTWRAIMQVDKVNEIAAKALQIASGIPETISWDPQRGRFYTLSTPHLLLPVRALIEASQRLSDIFGEQGADLYLYLLAKKMATIHASQCREEYNIADPLLNTLLGPFVFSFSGIGTVHIIAIDPQLEEGWFTLWYCPDSPYVEAVGNTTKKTACHFLAGYSAGWISTSLGINLDAVELMCRVKGDPHCRFLVARPDKLFALKEREEFYTPVDESKVLHMIPPSTEKPC